MFTAESISIKRRDFESEFWGRDFFDLSVNPESQQGAFESDLRRAKDFVGPGILECNLNLQHLPFANSLSRHSFVLADTRATFLTRIDGVQNEPPLPQLDQNTQIRRYHSDDLTAMHHLLDRFLIDAPSFRSRFRDTRIFGVGAMNRWYHSWIDDVVHRPRSLTSVAEVEGQVVGFFIFESSEATHSDGVIYRGILTTVDPRFRGRNLHLHLQQYLQRFFPNQTYWIENSTQISNYAVLNNHITSGRRLQKCELTFLWAQSDEH